MRKRIFPDRKEFLATETGGWRKKWKGRLPIALIFPNYYSLGMSNLGFQLVYDFINRHPDFVCERVFLPEKNGQPVSIESQRSLRDFPLLFCSVSFEQDYLNLLRIMLKGGVEPLAIKRQPHSIGPGKFPMVVGGGVATQMNPEPLAPFMDFFVIGEAEPVLMSLLDIIRDKIGQVRRQELLQELAFNIKGCYVPIFYDFTYNTDHTLARIKASGGGPDRIQKLCLKNPKQAGYSRILTPHAEFSDMFLTELGRGCSRGCRFCAAGFVYRPPRLWSAEKVIEALKKRPDGVNRVGLLGMEMASFDDLDEITEYLLGAGCSLSFSSLRADAVLRPGLQRLLQSSGIKTAALAPDGGSERLRRVINKGFREEDILEAAGFLFEAGVTNLKLYFMIGLPTETLDDLEELVELVILVRERMVAVGRPKGRLATLTLSVNCFVPKPWTPFQYAPFVPVKKLKSKLKFIRKGLTGIANIKINFDSPDRAYFQAVLARGDRRVGEALLLLAQSEKNWRQLFREIDIDPAYYALRERSEDEHFPWEILDHGIRRKYLWSEYRQALAERTTESCNTESCKRCGVCI